MMHFVPAFIPKVKYNPFGMWERECVRESPGHWPTTGSRQKYSAAKAEVASESLPVAPFARRAPVSCRLAPTHCGRPYWYSRTLSSFTLWCNLKNKTLNDVELYVVTVTAQRRYFLCRSLVCDAIVWVVYTSLLPILIFFLFAISVTQIII